VKKGSGPLTYVVNGIYKEEEAIPAPKRFEDIRDRLVPSIAFAFEILQTADNF